MQYTRDGRPPLTVVQAPTSRPNNNPTQEPDPGPDVDLRHVTFAARLLLAALRVDLSTAARAHSAEHMAQALAAMVTTSGLDLQTLTNETGHQELIVSKDIGFRALCEEHMLPLCGRVHVGYIPGAVLLAPSEPTKVVRHFSRQPQSPQRLACQVANWLNWRVEPRGIGVVIHAEHSCDAALDVTEPANTVTSSLVGQLCDNAQLRAHFLALTSSS